MSRADHLRVPPCAIDAEQAVLGGVMLVPPALDEVADLLSEASFYRGDHRLIWRAITDAAKAGKPFDYLTLGDWFESMGLADQVQGGAYLIELANTTPSAANVRLYAQIVADKARLREMIQIGTEIVDAGFDPQGREAVELIGQGQTRLGALLASEPCDLEEVGPVLDTVFGKLQARCEAGGGIDGLSTELEELDRVLNGLKGGRLYVLAARPKMGKTTLALNIAEAIALGSKKAVAVFSFEMTQEQLMERMVCAVGGVDHDRFRTGRLLESDWPLVNSAMRTLRSAPIRVSRPRNVRVETLVAQARRLHARKPQGLIVVDYLQLLDTKGAENRTQGISEITRQLKMLAIDLDVPVLVLSQLNRDLEKRADKRPIPADLRESGSIEQDADAVIFIYRDEVYNPGSADTGTAEIIVAANRDGPADTIRIAARLNICRFDNLADGWSPEMPVAGGKPRRKFGKGGNGAADRAAGDA